jgi:hypothetical protein
VAGIGGSCETGFTLNSGPLHELVNRRVRASADPAIQAENPEPAALLGIIGRILHVLRLPVNQRWIFRLSVAEKKKRRS